MTTSKIQKWVRLIYSSITFFLLVQFWLLTVVSAGLSNRCNISCWFPEQPASAFLQSAVDLLSSLWRGCTFCTGCTLQSTGSQLTRGIMCRDVGWCHSDHPKIVLWTVKRIKAEITSAVAGRFHQTDQHNSGGFDAKACGLLLSCLVMYF